jgi:hypothetical protein
MAGITTPITLEDRNHIYYRYVIRHKEAESLIRAMNNRGISCRRPIYKPLHHYLRFNGFPASESLWRQTLSLPNYPSLPEEEVEQIISTEPQKAAPLKLFLFPALAFFAFVLIPDVRDFFLNSVGRWLYIFLFAISLSALLTPFVKIMALQINAMDIPAERKIHESSTPLLGGSPSLSPPARNFWPT